MNTNCRLMTILMMMVAPLRSIFGIDVLGIQRASENAARDAEQRANSSAEYAARLLGREGRDLIDRGRQAVHEVSADLDGRAGQRIGQFGEVVQDGIQGANGVVGNAVQGATGIQDKARADGVIMARGLEAGISAYVEETENGHRRNGNLMPPNAPKEKPCKLVVVSPELLSYILKNKNHAIAIAGQYERETPNGTRTEVNLDEET